MRLVSLRIKNFRVLKEVNVVFPDRVIGIIGPNGAGKSSIIEAISWALYGTQVARSGKDEIKSVFAGRFEPCEVCLQFAVNGENYRVVRRIAGRVERPEVELYRGERSESVGVNETRKYVGELLGLDWRGFLTSFLARQQELNALSDLQPARRRDQLAGMLGIERIDKAIQGVKEDTRANERQVGFLENQLLEKGHIEQRITELTELIAQLSQQVGRSQESRKKAEAAFEEASQHLLELQQAQSTWLQVQAKLEAEKKAAQLLSGQLASLKREASRLSESQEELEQLEEKLIDLPSLSNRLEAMRLAKSRQEMRLTLAKQEGDLKREKGQVEARIASVNETLADYTRQLSTFEDNIQELLAEQQQRLEQTGSEYSGLKAKRLSLQEDIDKLSRQMESMAQFGPESVCDRCLRPLGDSLPQIKSHLSQELVGSRAAATVLDERLRAAEEEGRKLKQSCRELQTRVKAQYELTVKREACLKEQDSLRPRKEELEGRLTQVSDRLGRLPETDFDDEQFSSLKQAVEQLEQVRSDSNRLKGELARLPVVRQAVEEHASRLAAANDVVSSLDKKLGELAFCEEGFQAAQKSFKTAQQALETAKGEFLAASKEWELSQKELEGKLEQMKRFEKAAQDLEVCRSSQYYGQKLAGLFSEYRSHLIAGIRPTLAELSSQLMTEMTVGKYNLVELDEKYNLRIMDYGQYYAVDRFSGGEKDLANLCLRLAISLALTESAGLSRSFIILDEVFGSQDSDRKELIIKALAHLKNRFPQILLVTHVDDIRDRVEELIEVVPTGAGWSEVKVNGSPA